MSSQRKCAELGDKLARINKKLTNIPNECADPESKYEWKRRQTVREG